MTMPAMLPVLKGRAAVEVAFEGAPAGVVEAEHTGHFVPFFPQSGRPQQAFGPSPHFGSEQVFTHKKVGGAVGAGVGAGV